MVCDKVVWKRVCDKAEAAGPGGGSGRREREAGAGGGSGRRERDTESKTRTPHKDAGKKNHKEDFKRSHQPVLKTLKGPWKDISVF